jgi:hypothetical protein
MPSGYRGTAREKILENYTAATCDVPAVAGLGDAVAHAMVSKAAEWELGDQIDVIARAAGIRFVPST